MENNILEDVARLVEKYHLIVTYYCEDNVLTMCHEPNAPKVQTIDIPKTMKISADVRQKERAKEKTEKKARAKNIDWPKAEALKQAGWTDTEIAKELEISYQTIKSHFKRAMA